MMIIMVIMIKLPMMILNFFSRRQKGFEGGLRTVGISPCSVRHHYNNDDDDGDDDVGDDNGDEDDIDDDDQKRPIQTLQWWKPSLANLCNILGSERVTTYTFSAGSQNDFLFKKWINFSLAF